MAWEPNDLDLRANYDLGVEAGKAMERERIIKLLEKYEAGGSDPETCDYIPHERLIALIKGEQSE